MTSALFGISSPLVSLRAVPTFGAQQALPASAVAPARTPASGRKTPTARFSGDRSVAASAAAPASGTLHNVEDIMTRGNILTVRAEDPLDHALEILVEHHVTGLPVIDNNGAVVGVVSDFDLLALEGVTTAEKAKGFFPEVGAEWNSFFEVQRFVEKNKGKRVGDVMTCDPVCVKPTTSIEDAANLLLRMKIRRLPVVDDSGRLCGILTRSNIIKAAWEARQAAARQ